MKKIILICLCIIGSCCFIGCKNDSIEFNRDPKFNEVLNSLQLPSNEPKVKRSSGVVIYKDETQQKNQNSGTNFGPNDINFDIKDKF